MAPRAQKGHRAAVQRQPGERSERASLGGDDQVDALVGRRAGESAPQDAACGVPVALGKIVALARLVDVRKGSRREEPPHDRLRALVVPQQEPLHLAIAQEGGPRGQGFEPHGVAVVRGDQAGVGETGAGVLQHAVDDGRDGVETKRGQLGSSATDANR